MNEEVQFHYGSLSSYMKSDKSENVLYFTDDTHQLFKGEYEITKSAKVVPELPDIAHGEYGALYICGSSAYVFDGSDFNSLFNGDGTFDFDIISNDEIDSLF